MSAVRGFGALQEKQDGSDLPKCNTRRLLVGAVVTSSCILFLASVCFLIGRMFSECLKGCVSKSAVQFRSGEIVLFDERGGNFVAAMVI